MINQSRQWIKIDQTFANHDNLKTQLNEKCVSVNNDNVLQFSLMSYNILSQNLLNSHLYLYRHCAQTSISWPERGNRIVNELLEANCDIICLQEVNSDHYREIFLPALQSKGYLSLYKKKTGDELDGCAIFYNSSKFSVDEIVKVEFKRLDLSPMLDSDNIALIAKFNIRNTKSDVKLIIANTHLLYNPIRGDVKTAQLRLLFAEIDKLAVIEKNGSLYNPIIFCGDFNSEPGSPIYEFIRNGFANFNNQLTGDLSGQTSGIHRGNFIKNNMLNIKCLSTESKFTDCQAICDADENEISHSFNFNSVYEKTQFNRKYISSFTCIEPRFVDYIFFSKSDLLQLKEYLQLLSYQQIRQMGFLPNSILGSDHIYLMANFSIKY